MGTGGLNGLSKHGEIYSPDTKCPPFEDSNGYSWDFSFPHTFTCIGVQSTTTPETTTTTVAVGG